MKIVLPSNQFSQGVHTCVSSVCIKVMVERPQGYKIQWCFFNHTDNLDSPEESEVENSEKRKGNKHLQEEDLSIKWIGLKWVWSGSKWSNKWSKWSVVDVHSPYRKRWRKLWKNQNEWGTVRKESSYASLESNIWQVNIKYINIIISWKCCIVLWIVNVCVGGDWRVRSENRNRNKNGKM